MVRLIKQGAPLIIGRSKRDPEVEKKLKQSSTEPQWSELIGNIPGSAAQAGSDMLQPFLHPVQTAQNIGGLTKGVQSKLTPGEATDPRDVLAEEMLGNVGQFYKERYGGMDNIKRTVIEDPVGALMDASMLVSGGGTALKGAGALSKSSKLAKAGNIATKVGEFTDPISVAGKVTRPVGNLIESVPGNLVDTYLPRPKMADEIMDIRDQLYKGEKSMGKELTDRSRVPIRAKKLAKFTEKKIDETAQKIEEQIKPFLDKEIDINQILDPPDVGSNRMTISKLYDMVNDSAIPNKEPILKDINEVVESIYKNANEQGKVKLGKIHQKRKNTDKWNKNIQGKSIGEISPQQAISKIMSDELRNIINDAVPDLREINQEYGLWRDMEEAAILQVAKNKRSAKPTAFDVGIGGGGAALAAFTVNPLAGLAALVGPYVARRIMTSSSTGLTAARLVQELLSGTKATSRVTGPTSRTSYMLERPLNESEPSAQLVN